MQSDGEGGEGDGGTVNIDIDWTQLIDPLINGIEDTLDDNLVNWIINGIAGVFEDIIEQITDYFETLFQGLIGPIVGTPAPRGPSSSAPVDIAFQTATNPPWDTLISDLYFDGIVGLALGIQFITWIIIGLRYKSINPAVREKLGRRCLIAFLSLFLWLPLASMGAQFFDTIGRAIALSGYTDAEAIATLLSLGTVSSAQWGVGLLLIILAAYVYLKALFVFLTRYVLTILLTIAMPLVASFWVLEVWPFNRFAGLSKQIAGAYPGLLAAGIPPAILIRASLLTTDFGLGDLSFFVAIVTVYLAAKSQKIMIRRSADAAVRVSEAALAGSKKSVKTPVKIGAAVGVGAATIGAGAIGGKAAAGAVGRGAQAVSNAAKGRVGRAAFSAQMVHRNMASNSGSPSTSPSDTGSSTGAGYQQSMGGTSGQPTHGSGSSSTGGSPQQNGSANSSPAGGNGSNSVPSQGSSSGSAGGGTTSKGRSETSVNPAVRKQETNVDSAGAETRVPRNRETVTYSDVDFESTDTKVFDSDAGTNDVDDGGAGNNEPSNTGGNAQLSDLFASEDERLGPEHYR